ncbi:MAG: hypothetical protein EOS25_32960 [Mesorhizobium sp.]|uniref:hypothetical protein n=1 Tax=Mesorhizobium sp. TaxID=1871066 RepID=UPI000FE53FA3|nr:hypothetical protein [Mesorhizobium sp.]RWE63028.1 MAG: hypothetical protein EOS24_05300 [Mesorhizobium sp.]RWF08535.1 MAG: hypothetical protein EOS25_32960 [Mesorhizobium sp.]RWF09802.1 MAG: hypothetical protein EOS69_17855 [Mesorhizobium sp.]
MADVMAGLRHAGAFAERAIADSRATMPADLFEATMALYEQGRIEPRLIDGEYGWGLVDQGGKNG